MTIAIWPARLNKCTEATARSPLWFPCYISSMSEWENLWMIVLKQGSSEACKLVWSFHLCPYSSTNSLLLSGGLLPRKKWKWSVVWGGFKKSCTSGKGTIHGLRLQDFQDSETLRLWDIWRPFLFSLYCYQDMFWKVMKFIFQISLLRWTIQFHYLIFIWMPACEFSKTLIQIGFSPL